MIMGKILRGIFVWRDKLFLVHHNLVRRLLFSRGSKPLSADISIIYAYRIIENLTVLIKMIGIKMTTNILIAILNSL